jgi:prolipoprotein diacylglyceryltransferase
VAIAVLTFGFDPIAHPFGDVAVRWGVLALVVVLVASLLLSGLLARGAGLRVEDLAFIAIGAVPGAVVGGRLGYALLHWDYYGSRIGTITDPAVGSLELALGVLGGLLTAGYVARLLGAPVAGWLQVAIGPLLFALGAGKLTMVATGDGQGVPSDAPWATAYAGPGPWGSLAPALPSVPSQAFEGVATLIVLAALTLVLMAGVFERRDGRAFFVGLGAWGLLRVVVSASWRDHAVAFGLNAGGLLAVLVVVVSAIGFAWSAVLGPRFEERARRAAEVRWADPEARPRF